MAEARKLDERRAPGRHTVIMESRETISVTGVTEVLSFDEEVIVAEIADSVMYIRGGNLHVSRLNLDNGDLDVSGEIYSLTYEDGGSYGKGKASFLSKIFR